MILNLFYKAMRIITWIIIIMAVIFLISKLLPVIGDIFSFITKSIENIFHKLDSLKDMVK